MRCPDCGNRLLKITGRKGEWICDNDDCFANKRGTKEQGVYSEYYGYTQEAINKQRKNRISFESNYVFKVAEVDQE